jgi:hypothetical protein
VPGDVLPFALRRRKLIARPFPCATARTGRRQSDHPETAAHVNTAAAPRPSRTLPLAWLVLAQAISVASLLPWVLVAGFSFLFTPGVDEGLLPAELLLLLWAYPLVPIICSVGAWRAYRRGDTRRAVRWTLWEVAAAVVVVAFVGFVIAPVG